MIELGHVYQRSLHQHVGIFQLLNLLLLFRDQVEQCHNLLIILQNKLLFIKIHLRNILAYLFVEKALVEILIKREPLFEVGHPINLIIQLLTIGSQFDQVLFFLLDLFRKVFHAKFRIYF